MRVYRVQGLGLIGFRVYGVYYRVQGPGLGFIGFRFRVAGLGSRVWA